MKLYILTCNNSHIEYFLNREKAHKSLAWKRDNVVQRGGIYVVTDTADKFSYTMGWQEQAIVWEIQERDIQE